MCLCSTIDEYETGYREFCSKRAESHVTSLHDTKLRRLFTTVLIFFVRFLFYIRRVIAFCHLTADFSSYAVYSNVPDYQILLISACPLFFFFFFLQTTSFPTSRVTIFNLTSFGSSGHLTDNNDLISLRVFN